MTHKYLSHSKIILEHKTKCNDFRNMSYEEFVKKLDTDILANAHCWITDYKRGITQEKLRLLRIQIGRYRLRLATGWSPEISLISEPSYATLPLSEYKFFYCSIYPDEVGEKFISIISKSSVWPKFTQDRKSYSARLTVEEFYNLYQYIVKSTKFEILL